MEGNLSLFNSMGIRYSNNRKPVEILLDSVYNLSSTGTTHFRGCNEVDWLRPDFSYHSLTFVYVLRKCSIAPNSLSKSGGFMKSKILLVESKQADHESFGPALIKKGFQVHSVPNGSAALVNLLELDPDLAIIDAASLRTSGKRICQSLRQKLDGLGIMLIIGETQVKSDKVDADVVLTLPFTVQKLVNRMKILLPPDDKDLLHVGPIRLNIKQKQLRCLGKISSLTTRQVSLLKVLMEHPGEILERKALFCQVWETEYTGDTRTLDVHISWLRHSLEPDPRHPRLLKTIRGIGYRLDI